MSDTLQDIQKIYDKLGIKENHSVTPRTNINTGTLNKKMSTYVVNTTSGNVVQYGYKYK